MINVLPGRPQSRLQAVTTACWDGRQIIAYITGNAFVVLDGPNHVLQTTYTDLPTELAAIVIDEISGKIATCSSSLVYVYRPNTLDPEHPRWSLQCHLPTQPDDPIETLSWGLDEELLVGSSCLTLFSTHNAADHLWSKPLANSAKIAMFSYDTGLIATTGHYDRMVKIWRRLSLADQRFEYDYLPHPTVVTGFCWRRPFHRDQSFDNVLYTLCADNKLRVWSPGDSQSHHILQLWADIDLMDSIQPRTLEAADRSTQRFAFMIHSRDFTVATERAVQQSSKDEMEQMALHHLIEVANRSPEVCVVLDEKGNMSAWGLENVGSRHRMPGDVFNIAHVEGLEVGFSSADCLNQQWVQFHPFCTEKSSDPFSVLVHHFDGKLDWFEGKLDLLFNPAQQSNRLKLKTSWTGHSGEIKKVVRSVTGRSIITQTKDNESIVWVQKKSATGTRIVRSSVFETNHHIHRSWILQDGKFVAFLHYDSISLWDTRGPRAIELARKAYTVKGKPLCLLFIPETSADASIVHLATISSEMKGVSWEIHLPPANGSDPNHIPTLEDFDTFDLGSGDDLAFVLSVDPAGRAPVISGFLDTFARDIAISYTYDGTLTTWTARPDLERRKLDWLVTAVVDTSVENPSLASGTSIRKAALVNSDQTQLTIWSTKGASLEHEVSFDKSHGKIHDLDWLSTPDNQSILAVGFSHRILAMGQLRYDYLESTPAWATLREFNTLELTSHPIGDSVWLGGGSFVIGAGNQLFVLDDKIETANQLESDLRLSTRKNPKIDIFGLVSRLNGALPVYHPQYLAQFILCGKILLVQKILLRLWKVMKFYSDGDVIDSMLDLSIDDIADEPDSVSNPFRKDMQSSYADFSEDDEPESVTEEVVAAMNEQLTSKEVPALSSREQFLLADAVECVGMVEKHRRSIDENGCRYMLFFRQFALRQSQSTAEKAVLSWREITWAFHSGSQDILADLVTRHYHGRMLWTHARECGIFMWMKDLTALRAQFEVIARNEFTKSEDKNPIACSLYYLALRKKAILSGLWRMAGWNKEQAATQRLLSNNFGEAKWKTVALKNAYALMGKHRFEYAAAFFILADHLKDAVSVLSNQLNDMQLAIAVARVYEGDHGPVLQEFLNNKVLPHAVNNGNRWLATWALWMLGKRDRAVRVLVLPLSSVISPPETPRLDAKLFSADDPALVVLYKQLREKSLQTLRGAVSISPRVEWEFVMHTARLYCRMGCDLLALDLVRNWEFLAQPASLSGYAITSPTALSFANGSPQLAAFDLESDPRRLLRRRSSLVVDDLTVEFQRHSLADEPSIVEDKEAETINGNGEKKSNGDTVSEPKKKTPSDEKKKKKPPPTMFHEPDANSLLDSFGF